MKNSVTALKNYLSVFRARLIGKETISDLEMVDFVHTIEKSVESIEAEFDEHEKRLDTLEAKRKLPTNQSSDVFVSGVISKIDILKNIIKAKMGNPDEGMFSFNLMTVETIEQEIKDGNTVTKHQLEQLNKIYVAEKDQI